MFESLENRQLFNNAGFTPLYINGTNANDSIIISQSGNVLTVVKNGVTTTHVTFYMTGGIGPGAGSPKGISKIVIHAFGGDDFINTSTSVQIPMEIHGGAGSDFVRGGSSADKLYGDTPGGTNFGYDSIEGAAGNDLLTGGTVGQSSIYGGAGNDTVVASGGGSTVYGGDGNDSVLGKQGNDYVSGENGNDYISGSSGVDYLRGGAGNDQIFGGAGNDVLNGDDGNDALNGDGQEDYLNGGADDDILNGGDNAADVLYGGTGNDTVDYSGRTENITVSFDNLANDGATNEHDNVRTDVEFILGGSGTLKILFSDRLIKLNGDVMFLDPIDHGSDFDLLNLTPNPIHFLK